ncbi:MAG UNVERIFIED_CONTAM: hypothetical protein LVR18_36550 [Planctomycetaceae bacterium]|jgi:hypothetical protein
MAGPLLTQVNTLVADVLGGGAASTIPVSYRVDEPGPGAISDPVDERGGLAEQILNSEVSLRHPMYRWGSLVLLAASACLLVRLMFDESLTRRPRLDQNLNLSGSVVPVHSGVWHFDGACGVLSPRSTAGCSAVWSGIAAASACGITG